MKNKIKTHTIICLLLTLVLGSWITKSTAQSTAANNTCNAANFLGWTTNCDLPFKMNGTNLMTLHHTSGNLNLIKGTSAYQIDSNNVLWHNNHTENIFVGVNAGNGSATGLYNTIVGSGA